MRRFFLVVALAYGLVLMGLASLNGALLAFALPFVIVLGASLLFRPATPDLQITREIDPQRAAANTPVRISITIVNRGNSLEEVLIEDILPAGISCVEGETKMIAELPANASVSLSYKVQGKRGIYQFDMMQVSVTERLGLIEKTHRMTTKGQLFVMPEVPSMKRVAIRPRQTRVYAGSVPARLGGQGIDIYGVRGYQPGDPMRHINWRVSARRQEMLYTNEFEQERVADVWLLLDARQRSDIHSPQGSLFEHAVSATAGLAQALVNDGNRVGLLVYGGFLDWTYPGYGKVQRELIWRALARAKPGESLVFEKLENLPTRVFPYNSQLILISPLHNEDLPILVHLRARGFSVLVVSPDPIEFEEEVLENERGIDLSADYGYRLARIERNLLLAQMSQAGVHVLNWNVRIPFDRAMHYALTRFLPWVQMLGVRR